jgi:hypothetical protein
MLSLNLNPVGREKTAMFKRNGANIETYVDGVLTASGATATFVIPQGVSTMRVTAAAGGGGGGGGNTTSGGGGGGGGGAQSVYNMPVVCVPGEILTITKVGSGGSGGAIAGDGITGQETNITVGFAIIQSPVDLAGLWPGNAGIKGAAVNGGNGGGSSYGNISGGAGGAGAGGTGSMCPIWMADWAYALGTGAGAGGAVNNSGGSSPIANPTYPLVSLPHINPSTPAGNGSDGAGGNGGHSLLGRGGKGGIAGGIQAPVSTVRRSFGGGGGGGAGGQTGDSGGDGIVIFRWISPV